jgi:predicted aldo/keto reductase-like oxidoreductase
MSNGKKNRRTFIKQSISASAGVILVPKLLIAEKSGGSIKKKSENKTEWRNRQSDMAYRMFGNTGMMISEIGFGALWWDEDESLPMIRYGIEKGINYIDTASRYFNGRSEECVGALLRSGVRREDLFIATKLSHFTSIRDELAEDILDDLPSDKEEKVRQKAESLMEKRGVFKPGYHFKYFGSQNNEFARGYLTQAVIEEYGYPKGEKERIKNELRSELQNSLERLNTDYVDILHCPHGARTPEELEDEILRELLEEFKQKGYIRFSALSMHNDVTGNLEKAIELGIYDGAMPAYNIANHASLEKLLTDANNIGMGIIAMKVAKAIHDDVPKWRIDKLNEAIPERMSKYAKSYLWALQNTSLSGCVSEFRSQQMIDDNISVVGQKIELESL